MRDAPDIERTLLTGYPEDYEEPRCPICGREPEYGYYKNNELIGCDCCVKRVPFDSVKEFYKGDTEE